MPATSLDFISLNISILTVSDTRTEETDKSGQSLVQALQQDGHLLANKVIVKDNVYLIRSSVSQWIADPDIQIIIITGGTGFSHRDITPEAITPLLDKTVPGFGELFRHISLAQIGVSTVQSRAFAGMANGTFIFALPGSTNACKTAWDGILHNQLDIRHKPCNFVELLPSVQSRKK